MYGREAVFPCEVPVNLPLENIILPEETSYEGYFDEKKSRLEDSKEKTSENMEKSQEKQKKAHMKKVLKKYKNISYSVGNEVLLYNMRRKGRKGGRMEPDFFGPYTIMEICGKVVKLCTLDGAPLKQKINVDHIKPYIRSARTTAPKTQASSEEIITSVSSVPHRASVIHFATIKIKILWSAEDDNSVAAVVGPYNLYVSSFHTLRGTQWLVDEIVIMSQKRIILIDPLGHEQSYVNGFKTNWMNFLSRYELEELKVDWKYVTMAHQKQQDSSSCGVLILMFAKEFILSRNLHEVKTSEEYISNARLQIACDLLQYKGKFHTATI
ncbi:uncharacterized protein RCH25_025715 [Pelodytes ibericus]